MKIATLLSYSGGFRESIARVSEMERAGLDLVWVAEAYGFDSPSLMGMIAGATSNVEIGSAILPIYTRTPSLLAMTAAGLDELSEGRFHLGLGASGPQVIEGFHGLPYNAPLGRTKEVVEICRLVWRRDAPLAYDGRYYTLPLPTEEGTGLGKSLKIIAHPRRPEIPIWLAALGDRNVEQTAEIASGWIPHMFAPELAHRVWGSALSRGLAKRDPALGPLQITAGGLLAVGESSDVVAVRERARPTLALYIGGMGAKGKNFYNDVAARYGFEKEAALIQDLYLSGRKDEAAAQVPADLVELTNLCGPASYVAERLMAFREAGVTHLKVDPVPVGAQSALELISAVKEMAS
jgi:F420-dependent oxidoreductase-like protein